MSENKIKTLEEKVENLEKIIILDSETAEEECAETIIECIISQCDSNKDSIEALEKKYKELFKTVHGIYPDKVDTYEEIMRKHLKSHIVVAREQLTDKDKLTIFREFDEAIQKQLEKLEGDSKGLTLPQMREQLRFIRATMGDPEVYNENGTLKDGEKKINLDKIWREGIKKIAEGLKPSDPDMENALKILREHHEDYMRLLNQLEKETTEKEDHEFDYDYNCVKCGKNMLELVDRIYLTTEFDTHNTHKIVQKKTLEGWKSKVQNYTSDNSIDSYNRLFSIIQEIDQYLGESEKE